MATSVTDNDAEIARILAEDEEYYLKLDSRCSCPSESSCHVSSENSAYNTTNQIEANGAANLNSNEEIPQHHEIDSEIAYILQIEEIVFSEDEISKNTVDGTQLEKAHADMTEKLIPTNDSSIMTRSFAMFTAIQARYVECKTKNQAAIEQVQRLSMELGPLLLLFKTNRTTQISRTAIPGIALALISNFLQGKLPWNEAKTIMLQIFQMWNESSIWYKFLEQLVYILVALTIPSFTAAAIEKAIEKISKLI